MSALKKKIFDKKQFVNNKIKVFLINKDFHKLTIFSMLAPSTQRASEGLKHLLLIL